MNARDRIALSAVVLAIGRQVTRIHEIACTRAVRPWTAMVIVPLAMTAATMLLLWWLWLPLTVCAWWWADRSRNWSWLISVEAGAIGSQWSYLGAFALADWPAQRLLVGLCWVAYALLIAIASIAGRWFTDRGAYQGF